MVGVSAEVGFGARMGKDLVFRLGISIYYYYFLQLVLKIKCHFCLFWNDYTPLFDRYANHSLRLCSVPKK